MLVVAALLVPLALAPQEGLLDLGTGGPLFEAEVDIEEVSGPAQKFTFGVDKVSGVKAVALTHEGRPGLGAVIAGHAETLGPGGRSGMTLLFFVYIYSDGGTFVEAQLLNDAIDSPPGRLRARYEFRHRGEVMGRSDGHTFHDQTGVCHVGGDVRSVPRHDLLTRYVAGLPPIVLSDSRIDTSDAGPREDPDPTPAGAGGWERNRYHAVEAVKFLFTRDARYLERLVDFAAAQARRPYHLSEKNGEPFLAARYPDVQIVGGRPALRIADDPLGRDELEEEQRSGGAHDGWDPAFLTVEELYAAYVLSGSRVARREMVLIAEGLLTTPAVQERGQRHESARTFGWIARTLVHAYRATGAVRYLDAVQRMMVGLDDHRIVKGNRPALVPQSPSEDGLPDGRWESPFHVAIAAAGLAMYLEERPDDELARELLVFCGDLLVDRGFEPKRGGFYDAYGIDRNDRVGNGRRIGGEAMMICAPLLHVTDHVPEESRARYADAARRLYEANRQERRARIESDQFFRWFLRAARDFR